MMPDSLLLMALIGLPFIGAIVAGLLRARDAASGVAGAVALACLGLVWAAYPTVSAGGVLRARWAEERDIADPATLRAIADGLGLDGAAIAARADRPETAVEYEAATQRAIDAQVFGVPWYVYRGEPFWGQDRLDFLARALSK